MKVVRKIGLLSLLLVATVLVNNASALLSPMLPKSSYATAVGNWQGSSYYDYGQQTNGGYLSGRVDFAVYDTTFVSGEEAAFVADFGDTYQYLYVYQIFNDDVEELNNAVNYFAVFNLDETTLSIDENKITSVDGTVGGVEPTSGYLGKDEPSDEDDSRVIWEFNSPTILKGEHSWYLAFSTNSAPVVGDYEIKARTSDFPGGTPEPGMMTLFGIGAAIVLRKRRKSAL